MNVLSLSKIYGWQKPCTHLTDSPARYKGKMN
jgi:hypothetical protein